MDSTRNYEVSLNGMINEVMEDDTDGVEVKYTIWNLGSDVYSSRKREMEFVKRRYDLGCKVS